MSPKILRRAVERETEFANPGDSTNLGVADMRPGTSVGPKSDSETAFKFAAAAVCRLDATV